MSANIRFPVHPIPTPPLATGSLFSKSEFLFCGNVSYCIFNFSNSFILAALLIISSYEWKHTLFILMLRIVFSFYNLWNFIINILCVSPCTHLFYFFLSNLETFSFSCWIALASISRTMLNRMANVDIGVLLLIIGGKYLLLLPSSTILAVNFCECHFSGEEFPFFQCYWVFS